MMKKILLQYFPSLNNYGTAMMGLVTAQYLYDHFGGDVEIYTEIPETNLAEAGKELRTSIPLKRYHHPYENRFRQSKGILKKFWQVYSLPVYREFDLVVVLGGDNISEYYSRFAVMIESAKFYLQRFYCPIVLLGQTIGPFNQFINRVVIRRTLRSIPIITRDLACSMYLQKELGLKRNVFQGADLAFCNLPLQQAADIEQDILKQYQLVPNQYVTIIVSAIQKAGYYCKDRSVYIQNWKELICRLVADPQLAAKKICLLAHTFHEYGEESDYIDELYQQLSDPVRERIVLVKEKILPTRARFILGNGYLTITGRMHASVSTFQMGKPAIVLAYSAKYAGVIGSNLNRNDLIIDANDSELWETKKIVDLIGEKVDYICANYERIAMEIREKVAVQKKLAESALEKCVEFAR